MTIVSLELMNRQEFCDLIFSNKELPRYTAAISITDPETPLIRIPFFRVMRTIRPQFWDVTKLVGGYTPATSEQIKYIYDFIQELIDNEYQWHLICHCEAGISRSAAIIAFLVFRLGLPFDEKRLEFANSYILASLKELLPGYYSK